MSLETERTLLATLLCRPGDCWGVELDPENFSSEQHGEVFAMIRRLTADSLPADAVSVAEAFEREGKRAFGVLAIRLAGEEVTTTQPKAFADRIRGAWRLRQAHAIAADLHGAREESAIDVALERLLSLNTVEVRHEYSARDAVGVTLTELQAIHDGSEKTHAIPSGLIDLDRILGGFHRGDLVVIGARPSMGKTALALGMARNAATAGCATGLISGEQPVEQVSARLLSLASGVHATRFRSGIEEHEWARVTEGSCSVAALPLWIYDRSSPSLVEVVRTARRWSHKHHIGALYVDYLQRLEADGERRFEVVGAAVKGLKNLARDLHIPVIVLAQVSRQVEQRRPPEPRMGDLSDSSEIEKEADVVLMLYRDEHYNPESEKRGVAKIIVEKNRHGPTGFVEVAFDAPTMRFASLSRADTPA